MQAPTRNSITPVAAAVTAALYPGFAALAQEADDSAYALEEIIVTATKRDVSMQDIPATIQAITQESLAAMGAKSMEDYWGAKIDDDPSTWDYDKARPFPMAIVFGVTPEFILAGANSALPHENNDFAFIGGLKSEPVEIVKCRTIDVDVPANAEIVVEGVLKPFNWATQGQFASFNGFYDVPRRRPIFDITGITMRKNPMYQHVHIGLPLNECNSIAAFFRSVRCFLQLKEIMPNVTDVFVDPAAGCGFTVHVAMKKARIGEPKMAMMRAYTALAGTQTLPHIAGG